MTETRTTQPSTATTDIRTSELTARLGEDDDHWREYSAVLHDKPVIETPAQGKRRQGVRHQRPARTYLRVG